jgi:hypothetical protein
VTELCRCNRGRHRGLLTNSCLVSVWNVGFSSLTTPLLARYRSTRPQDHKSPHMGLYERLCPSSSINWRLKSTTSLRKLPCLNPRSRGVASWSNMNIPTFNSSVSSKKMVWLFLHLIEWMCWRIGSSLQSEPSSFTIMVVPLDCIVGRMML